MITVIKKHKMDCIKCDSKYIYEVHEDIKINHRRIFCVCKNCLIAFDRDIDNVKELTDKPVNNLSFSDFDRSEIGLNR